MRGMISERKHPLLLEESGNASNAVDSCQAIYFTLSN
jgi:hypothetical protein